jgi:hypothetical protein
MYLGLGLCPASALGKVFANVLVIGVSLCLLLLAVLLGCTSCKHMYHGIMQQLLLKD